MAFWLVNAVITWLNNEISWDFGLMETWKVVFWLKLFKRDSEVSLPVRFLEIWFKETLNWFHFWFHFWNHAHNSANTYLILTKHLQDIDQKLTYVCAKLQIFISYIKGVIFFSDLVLILNYLEFIFPNYKWSLTRFGRCTGCARDFEQMLFWACAKAVFLWLSPIWGSPCWKFRGYDIITQCIMGSWLLKIA